jgi:DNA-binding response OmpR family regulator
VRKTSSEIAAEPTLPWRLAENFCSGHKTRWSRVLPLTQVIPQTKRALDAGADILHKPFHLTILDGVLREYLSAEDEPVATKKLSDTRVSRQSRKPFTEEIVYE